jgi:hypothetical protein
MIACGAGAMASEPCRGFMVLPESLEALPQALEDLPAENVPAKSAPSSILHVVFDPSSILPQTDPMPRQPSSLDGSTAGDSEVWPPLLVRHAIHKELERALQVCDSQLRCCAVAHVSFLCVTPNAEVLRCGFCWDADAAAFIANDMLSFVEPPTAAILETHVLPPVALYVPSHAHQLHSFIVQVRISVMDDNVLQGMSGMFDHVLCGVYGLHIS